MKRNTLKVTVIVAVVAAIGVLVSGCSSTPKLDTNFIDSSLDVSEHAFLYVGATSTVFRIGEVGSQNISDFGRNVIFLLPPGEHKLRLKWQTPTSYTINQFRPNQGFQRPASLDGEKDWDGKILIDRLHYVTINVEAGRHYFLYYSTGNGYRLVDETDPVAAWKGIEWGGPDRLLEEAEKRAADVAALIAEKMPSQAVRPPETE